MGNIVALADKNGNLGYPVTVSDAVVIGDKTLTEQQADLKTYVNTQDAKKLDKSGGTITGNLTVNGAAEFKTKVTFPKGGNVGTVLDIPGNLGIGSRTDPNVTGRIFTERKISNPNSLVVTKSSIGYNPITNIANTLDYGMKYQVQYNSGIDNYDCACFYLSYNGCVIGYSGDSTKRISAFYNVLHEGNAYFKDEVDTMVNVLKDKNEELERQVLILRAALESLGVDLDSIDENLPSGETRDIDVIEMIQSRERGTANDENSTVE